MLQSCAFTWRVFGCGLRITTASYHQQQTSTPIWNEAVNDQSHRHAKQILQSGLRILKYSEDTESLRNNIINREMDIDMDKLVRIIIRGNNCNDALMYMYTACFVLHIISTSHLHVVGSQWLQ